MKQILSVFCLLFLISSCTEPDNNVIQYSTNDQSYQDDRQEFLQSTGYIEMVPTNSNGEDWKQNYIKTCESYPDHEFLFQYKLNVINHMVRKTDFLNSIDNTDSELLLDMYNDFKTVGGLETKYLLLNKLSEFYPQDMIQQLSLEAYKNGLINKEQVEKSLHLFIENMKNKPYTKLDELTLKIKQERVEESNKFLPLFANTH
ncbi:MAG: hypothetical protein ACO3MG_10760 [Saprospiraceae bacterium]|jgi:hypothetical protein